MQTRAGFATAMLFVALVAPVASAPVAAQSCSFPVTVTDGAGAEVTIGAEPSRVVTLSPSAAQTMWEIGAREKVVGLTKHASYLAGSEERTRVSTAEQLVSFEKVVDLQPDLVLAPAVVSNETVARLRDAGVTVYAFEQAETIDDVYEKTRRIGRLTGECAGAEETVSSMDERLGVVREATEGQERPDVLYLFFGYTAGKGTFIHELIETAGGNNVAADANITGYQQINPEVVGREDPDWIVRNSENPPGLKPAVFNQTTAARENQTVVVQIEHINQAAPRIVTAVETLAAAFHPDAYAAANATATPTVTNTATPASTSETSSPTATATPSRTTAGDGPGFGVLIAIFGGAAAVLGVRWR